MSWLRWLSWIFRSDSQTTLLDTPSRDSLPADEFDDQAEPPEYPDAWWIPRYDNPAAGELIASEPVDSLLHRRLSTVLDDPKLELPQLPKVAQSALIKLREPNANYRELSQLIGTDPVLAAEVLRVANSVLYRGANEVTRLEVAFARLGQRALRSIILSATVKNVVSIRTGGSGGVSLSEELWRCSLASAVLMSRMAQRHGLDPEDAFLIGLLHDIGMLAVLRVLHDYQSETRQRVPRNLFDQLAREWHEHIGLRLAVAWNLPEPLPEIIGNHHRDPSDDDPLQTQRLLVQFTDVCCRMLGYGPYMPYDFFELTCVKRLRISDCALNREMLASFPQLLSTRMDAP